MANPTGPTRSVRTLVQGLVIRLLMAHFTAQLHPNPEFHARQIVTTPSNGMDRWFEHINNLASNETLTILAKANAIIGAVDGKIESFGAPSPELSNNHDFVRQLLDMLELTHTHNRIVAEMLEQPGKVVEHLTPNHRVLDHDHLVARFNHHITHTLGDVRDGRRTAEGALGVCHIRLGHLLALLGVPADLIPDGDVEGLDTGLWTTLEPYQATPK